MSEDLNYYTSEAPGGSNVYVQNRVVNNRLLNQERFMNGKGGLIQLCAWGASDLYLHGNPEISFFEGGITKKLIDPRFHTDDVTKPFKVRQDDIPIPKYEKLVYSANPDYNWFSSASAYHQIKTDKDPDFLKFFEH